MSRTIVGTVLAFALAIAPVFYCAQSWAEPPWAPAAKGAAEEVASKFKGGAEKGEETHQDWRGKAHKAGEDVEKEVVHGGVDAVFDCLKEDYKGQSCKDDAK
jgi:hypothetical protein